MDKRYLESEVLMELVREQLQEGRKASFVVTGMSMWPFICHGRDSVVVERYEELSKYDIILYKSTYNRYILHRITSIQGNSIVTTGDGNCYRDSVIDRSQVIAKVVSHTYKGKEVDENNLIYQLLVKIWCNTFSIRPTLLRVLKLISKVKGMIHKS